MPAARLSSIALAIVLIAAGCSSAERNAGPATAGTATVFRNFTLIDGTGAVPLPSAAMVVEGGRIAWIGPETAMDAPAGAASVDLGGKYVMPGLIDLHVHLAVVDDAVFDESVYTTAAVEKALAQYASYGVTAVLAQGTDKDLIFPLIESQRSGTPSTTRVFTAGQGIVFEGGYGGVKGINDPVATAEEARDAVAAQSTKRADLIKLWVDDEFGSMPRMPPEISGAAIEAAHERGLRAVAHIFYREDAERLMDQGIDGLVHSVRDRLVDERFAEKMKERGVWQVSSTLSREAAMFAYADPDRLLADPFFTRAVPPRTLERLRSEENRRAVASGPHFPQYERILKTAQTNLKTLADAGVKFAFGTDSGPPGRFPGFSAHWELELMVEAGLSPAQALEAATRRAAEFLGAEDLGTLERGKWADFVVLGADPLADIRNTRTIEAVYIAGAPVGSNR